MGESNGDWGHLAEIDPDLAEVWDDYQRLPDAGEHDALDSFCRRKNIDIGSLVRIGARLADYRVLAFAGPGFIKYRNVETGQRWTHGTLNRCKMVPARTQDETDTVIVAEGETDAARLTMLYPDCDVAILPGGARRFTRQMGEQLIEYRQVLASYDADEAGDAGWAKLSEHVPQAQRFNPPGVNDWCEYEGEPPDLPPLPDATDSRAAALPILVSAGDLMKLELPEIASWFEHDVLPIGGQLVLHAPAKSFKSFIAIDMLGAIAQGKDWCCFEPTEEAARVAIVQFEIPPKYFRDRVKLLRQQAVEPALFDENFHVWSPLSRPNVRAGDKKAEDYMRAVLVESGIQVVLLDPVRRLMGPGMDMDKEQGARAPLQFMESLQNEGITVVFCHHDNKTGSKHGGGDHNDMTGSGAWAGDADTIVSVSIPAEYTVTDPKRNLRFLLRNAASDIGQRAMEITEDGRIVYDREPWTGGDPDDEDAPSI